MVLHLSGDTNKTDSDPAGLPTAAQRIIDEYPEDCIHIYTERGASCPHTDACTSIETAKTSNKGKQERGVDE